MVRSTLCVLIGLASGCGSKSDKDKDQAATPTTATPSKPNPPPDQAAKPAPAAPTKQNKVKDRKVSKQQLATFRKHMKAGWALQQEKKWAESVPEFEAALVAIADDQRALAELGWSAMNAGDFAKARKADEAAIRVAVDKNVKAAGLYNLGQVQEKTGDTKGALKSYQASLQLRPKKAVEQAIAKLGAKPEVAAEFCAAGKKPCDCVLEHAFDEAQLEQAKCEQVTEPPAPVAGFHTYHVTSDAYYGSQYRYLLDENNQLAAVLSGDYTRTRVEDTTSLVKSELKTIGGHQLLWIETKSTSMSHAPSADSDEAMNIYEETTRSVTLCVVGDAKRKIATRCPLRDVPLSITIETGKLDDSESDLKKTETMAELTIADDGTATVKLVKGPSDDALARLVGPHKLW